MGCRRQHLGFGLVLWYFPLLLSPLSTARALPTQKGESSFPLPSLRQSRLSSSASQQHLGQPQTGKRRYFWGIPPLSPLLFPVSYNNVPPPKQIYEERFRKRNFFLEREEGRDLTVVILALRELVLLEHGQVRVPRAEIEEEFKTGSGPPFPENNRSYASNNTARRASCE